jgi:hypothetical protein
MTPRGFLVDVLGALIVLAVGIAFAVRGVALLVWTLIGAALALLCYLLGRPCE